MAGPIYVLEYPHRTLIIRSLESSLSDALSDSLSDSLSDERESKWSLIIISPFFFFISNLHSVVNTWKCYNTWIIPFWLTLLTESSIINNKHLYNVFSFGMFLPWKCVFNFISIWVYFYVFITIITNRFTIKFFIHETANFFPIF